MKFLILFALIAFVSAYTIPSLEDYDYEKLNSESLKKDLFTLFKSRFNKLYESTQEESIRFEIFKKNLAKINELQKSQKGTAQYKINSFADLSEQEFLSQRTGWKPATLDAKFYSDPVFDKNAALPEKLDWREQGAVTRVKDQGSCGSCWAFSTTGNIEGVNFVNNKKLVSVSEQQLVDCDKKDGGCNGGLVTWALESLIEMGGIESDSDYPYTAVDGECKFNKDLVKIKFNSYTNLTQNEDEIAQYLTQHGPIATGINAMDMQFYSGGVSYPDSYICNPRSLNHGVLIVGFGTEKNENKKIPYWIIKNSWGPSWGENGYYRIYRGEGACGINQMASSVVM